MTKITNIIEDLLSRPALVFAGIAFISAFSLVAALIAEHVFGLLPCILCIYQRVPFAIAIALGLLGFMNSKNEQLAPIIMGASSLTFLANSGIAFYHTGVERHWWPSFLEGCAIPDLGDDPEKILEAILSAPAVRCDEIPWADPILGLSMANYNVMLCLGLSVACLISAILIRKAY